MRRRIPVFFYGSYINRAVLDAAGVSPDGWQKARLDGHRLVIAPRANLVIDRQAECHGFLTTMDHAALARLYDDHARGVLGQAYLPEAVLVTTEEGDSRPALCYLAQEMTPARPDPAYVERIAAPAEAAAFPAAYVAAIRAHSG